MPAREHGLDPKGSGNGKGLSPGNEAWVVPGVEVGVAGLVPEAGLRLTHPLLPS